MVLFGDFILLSWFSDILPPKHWLNSEVICSLFLAEDKVEYETDRRENDSHGSQKIAESHESNMVGVCDGHWRPIRWIAL